MSDTIFLAVLNALWQGAALVGCVALVMRLGLRRNATTACLVWSAAFAIVALLPVLDFALARPAAPVSATFALPAPASVRRAPASGAQAVRATHSAVVPKMAAGTLAMPPRHDALGVMLGATAVRLGGVATAFARSWGIGLVGVWAAIAGSLLVRLALAYVALARLKRDAVTLDDPLLTAVLRRAGHRRRARIASSRAVAVPCAVGFRHPMILVPDTLAGALDRDDLARVVLHESRHGRARRRCRSSSSDPRTVTYAMMTAVFAVWFLTVARVSSFMIMSRGIRQDAWTRAATQFALGGAIVGLFGTGARLIGAEADADAISIGTVLIVFAGACVV
ncbi:MAG: M56 family metallopeptidase, partial [Candidatus Elarobacter sp.]